MDPLSQEHNPFQHPTSPTREGREFATSWVPKIGGLKKKRKRGLFEKGYRRNRHKGIDRRCCEMGWESSQRILKRQGSGRE